MFNTKNILNRMMGLSLLASLGLVALLSLAQTDSALAAVATSPALGVAGTYSILAGSEVTNSGATTISGDVGISPGVGPIPHYSGFDTVTLGGTIQDANAAALAAQGARDVAKLALNGQACTGAAFNFIGSTKELAGQNLPPGVYCADSFHLTNGTLTLIGTAADVWIFQSASDLIITGGAAAKVVSPSCAVWWTAVSAATFDAGSSLIGNILADTKITLADGAALKGRALAHAEVTLIGNSITTCPASPAPGMAALTLIKTVNGGIAAATDWTLSAAGSTPISGVTGTLAVTNAAVSAGSYTLSESVGPSGYTAALYSCVKTTAAGLPITTVSNTISLAAGDTAICTIVNTFLAPGTAALTLIKTVNGGSAAATDWTLSAAGSTPISGVTGTLAVTNAAVSAGSYTLSESVGPSGYTAALYSCVKTTAAGLPITTVSNTISLAAGDTAICTITNTFAAPAAAVPTLNEWGVIIFMLLAGLGSIYYLRKYRRV